jgi:membrane associated rhomboid family serine protease
MSGFLRRLSKALGLSYTWWQWRWLNLKKRWTARFSPDRNIFRHLRSGQKLCRKCGALAGAGERRCAVCGARLPSAAGNFLDKVFGLIMPGVSPVTAALTAAIGVNFLVQVLGAGPAALLRPALDSLLRVGALDSRLVAAGEWWRLLTAVFVHIGVLHLAFNVYALLSVSSFLEGEIGPARYLALFLLTGLAGSSASYLFHPRVVSAGASGAIFGLIGFAVTYFRREGSARGGDIRAFMVRWALYAFLFGLFVGADNYAHAGGFAAGLLLGAVIEIREDDKRRRAPFWKALAAVLALALVAAFALLLRGR